MRRNDSLAYTVLGVLNRDDVALLIAAAVKAAGNPLLDGVEEGEEREVSDDFSGALAKLDGTVAAVAAALDPLLPKEGDVIAALMIANLKYVDEHQRDDGDDRETLVHVLGCVLGDFARLRFPTPGTGQHHDE